MAWIIGLDIARAPEGAIAFMKWFTSVGVAPGATSAIAVHVLEEEHLRYVLRDHHIDEVVKGASEELQRRIAAAGASEVFSELRVLQALQADEAIEEARASAGAEGVIVIRAAPRGGMHVVRLGRVVRRLLRTLASPVVVVPPDLRASAPGDGPIIALTDLHASAVGASSFAAATARRLGRRWTALHVARGFEADYLPLSSRERARTAHRAGAREALEGWLKAHSLQPDLVEVSEGSAIETTCEIAIRERSPLLVTGSRRLSTVERTLQTSFGSALAATSPVAVAVVPPPS